jgi:hypothetical protein
MSVSTSLFSILGSNFLFRILFLSSINGMSSSDDQSSRSFLAHFVILALGISTSDDGASDNESSDSFGGAT